MSWNAALGEISTQLAKYDFKPVDQEIARAVVNDLRKISEKLLKIFAEFGRKEINPAMMFSMQLTMKTITDLSAHYSKYAEPALHAALKKAEEMMKTQV